MTLCVLVVARKPATLTTAVPLMLAFVVYTVALSGPKPEIPRPTAENSEARQALKRRSQRPDK